MLDCPCCLQKRLHQTVDASKAHTPLGLLLNALRDHRPYMCNADDFLRVLAVQREGGCFRDMPGVITHQDGELMRKQQLPL